MTYSLDFRKRVISSQTQAQQSGFTSKAYRPHGWAEIGKKIFGDIAR
jgi:hypothetical protein